MQITAASQSSRLSDDACQTRLYLLADSESVHRCPVLIVAADQSAQSQRLHQTHVLKGAVGSTSYATTARVLVTAFIAVSEEALH
jgi:hypothetical protein